MKTGVKIAIGVGVAAVAAGVVWYMKKQKETATTTFKPSTQMAQQAIEDIANKGFVAPQKKEPFATGFAAQTLLEQISTMQKAPVLTMSTPTKVLVPVMQPMAEQAYVDYSRTRPFAQRELAGYNLLS